MMIVWPLPSSLREMRRLTPYAVRILLGSKHWRMPASARSLLHCASVGGVTARLMRARRPSVIDRGRSTGRAPFEGTLASASPVGDETPARPRVVAVMPTAHATARI
jgi:hypothetical protein